MRIAAALLWIAFVASASCGPRPGAGVGSDPDQVGSVSLALRLPETTEIASMHFAMSGPALGPALERDLDTRNWSYYTFLIGGAPAGTGYRIDMNALGADGKTTCGGSTTGVEIAAGATTQVTVVVRCRLPADTGGVQVDARIKVCPQVTSVGATPSVAAPGQVVMLAASGSDFGAGSRLSFTWAASGGTIGDGTVANTTYVCPAMSGLQTLTVTVSDGDPQCNDSASVHVTCAGAADAAANGPLDAATAPPPAQDAGADRALAPDAGAPDSGTIVTDPCLVCESTSASAECADRLQACANLTGVATTGPAAGQPRSALCLNLLTCVHATRCERGGPLSDCFCGAGIVPAACPGAAAGACRAQLYAAAESTDDATVLARLDDASVASGVAALLIESCEQQPAPLCGPSCGH